MRAFLIYALWTDLRRRSAWALVLSMVVIAVSIALCALLFSAAAAVRAAVEAEIIRSGAVNAMEVAARTDPEQGAPWAAEPIGTDHPGRALERLIGLLRGELGAEAITDSVPAWIAPGWVYLFLTPPEQGGIPVAAGVALTSPSDPERERVRDEQLAGGWIDRKDAAQVVLPEKLADRLWQDVLFVGEPAWIGITETTTVAQAEVVGIYARTQRDYAYANAPAVTALQGALAAARGEEAAGESLQFDRVRLYFDGRASLLRAREIAEQRYKFWAATPYDRFESRLRLAAAVQAGAWAVFAITLGSACGAIFCTFLAWVSRRRYEIALLKTQGAGNAWVAWTYVLQSVSAGLVAGGAGVAAAYLLAPRLAALVRREMELGAALTLQVPPAVALALVAAAVLAAAVAAALPARVAARQDPWEVLREGG